jgi:hypothetical protein
VDVVATRGMPADGDVVYGVAMDRNRLDYWAPPVVLVENLTVDADGSARVVRWTGAGVAAALTVVGDDSAGACTVELRVTTDDPADEGELRTELRRALDRLADQTGSKVNDAS